MRPSKFETLSQKAERLPPIPVAVVCPESAVALEGVLLATKQQHIIPILIGAAAPIKKIAQELGQDISNLRLIDIPDHEAIAQAIKLAQTGEIKAIMKGSLHTEELMAAIVQRESGLRTGRRMSHCQVVDVPIYKKLLVLTDAGLNIAPDLKTKKDITQNAIDLARAIGINLPKVALLSAVETVNPNMPSTVDADELCKMAENNEITDGILAGPLSFDLAVSEKSAKTKKMQSPVAGDADVLVVPNIEAGNVLTKALDYFAGATSLGIIIGAKIPVILTSRAANAAARAGSCMLAKFYMSAM